MPEPERILHITFTTCPHPHEPIATSACLTMNHYYRIGLCFMPFVPVIFGPGTKGGFCPGSNG